MSIASVDGCRGGWVVAQSDCWPPQVLPKLTLCPTFADVLACTRGCAVVVVDMPIGLPSASDWPRACDLAAKALLHTTTATQKQRVTGMSSRVFFTPPRAALSAPSAPEFQQLHRACCGGKGAGWPVWGLVPKLREVDATMTPAVQERVREFHPELAWTRLASEVLPSKHQPQGRAARRDILMRYVPQFDELRARRGAIGRGAAEDDILDALVGLHVAHGLTQVPTTAQRLPSCIIPVDENGLRAEIWY